MTPHEATSFFTENWFTGIAVGINVFFLQRYFSKMETVVSEVKDHSLALVELKLGLHKLEVMVKEVLDLRLTVTRLEMRLDAQDKQITNLENSHKDIQGFLQSDGYRLREDIRKTRKD